MAVDNRGRVKYIEPTNIYDEDGKLSVDSSEIIKNKLEDYCIAVDLAVIIPDRKCCGFANENGEKLTLKYSSNNGTISFLGGTNGSLTTNFTDINLMDPTNNTSECLGIQSIDVTYESWQYPEVNIKFIDVRGAAVMSPEEKSYQDGGDGSFYRALFTSPYPMFILKLKGFYGRGATYYLSVEDVTISLDSSSGNFEIGVKFIGQKYRIYSDIPMTYICAAPYMTAGKSYWDTNVANGKFVFKNANGTTSPMMTIPEFKREISNVSEALGQTLTSETATAIQNYDAKISELNGYKDAFPLNEWNFDLDKKIYYLSTKIPATTIINGINSYLDSCSADSETYKMSKGAFGLSDKADSFNEKNFYYNETGKVSGNGNLKLKKWNPHTAENSFFNSHDAYTEELSFFYAIKPTDNMLYNKEDLINKIFTSRITKLETDNTQLQNSYKNEREKITEAVLGFTPSIRNIYNLIFAHMDTFVGTFYNCTSQIKDQLNGGSEDRNVSTYAAETDLSKTEKQVPPFTEFLATKVSTGEDGVGTVNRIMPIWPEELNNGGKLLETNYVKDLLHGAKMLMDDFAVSGSTLDVNALKAIGAAINSDGLSMSPSVNTDKFLPITLYDLVYPNNNPYRCLATTNDNIEATIKAIFSTRAFNFLTTFAKYDKDKGWKGVDYKAIEAFGEVEAYNAYYGIGDSKNTGAVYDFLNRLNRREMDDGYTFIREISTMKESLSNYWDFTKGTEYSIFKQVGNGKSLEYAWYNDNSNYLPLSPGTLSSIKNDLSKKAEELSNNSSYLYVKPYNDDGTFNPKISQNTYYCFNGSDYLDTLFNSIKEYGGNKGIEKIKENFRNFDNEKKFYPPYLIYGTSKNKLVRRASGFFKYAVSSAGEILSMAKGEGPLDKRDHVISFIMERDYLEDDSLNIQEKAFNFLKSLPLDKEELKRRHLGLRNCGGVKYKAALLYEAASFWKFNLNSDTEENSKDICWESYLASSKSRRIKLANLFEEWANGSFRENISNIINNKYEGDNINGREDIDFALSANADAAAVDGPIFYSNKAQEFLRGLVFDLVTEIDFYPNKTYPNVSTIEQFCSLSSMKNAYDSFIRQLKELYKDFDSEEATNTEAASYEVTRVDDPFKNKDLKLSTYLTLKNLYDKWLCFPYKGRNMWKLGEKDSDFDSFIYLDSFYHDIGSELLVDVSKVGEWLTSCFPNGNVETNEGLMNNVGSSVYEFLSEVAQDLGCALMAFPQRIDSTTGNGINDMFTALPYNSDWDTDGSCFAIVYPYSPSQHLGNDAYADDGFNLTDKNVISSLDDHGFTIPAFGVSYARQNQAFFKNLTLNTEKAGTTEASLTATFDIASKNSESPQSTTLYGQDLYRVRTNYAYDCEFDMMGCIQIMPLMYFQLNNVPFWSGAYIIYKVSHNITAGEMTTHVTGQRICKNALPTVDGAIITTKAEADNNTGIITSTSMSNGIGATLVDGVIQGKDPSVKYDKNYTYPSGEYYKAISATTKDENVSSKTPLICLLPAHNGEHGKVNEWYWSSMVVDRIYNILKDKKYTNGVPYNVERLRTQGQSSTGYTGRQIAARVTKYGQDCVISIVPHWNGTQKGSASYIGFYTGNKNFYPRQDSMNLGKCFEEAAQAVAAKKSTYQYMPRGMMDKGAYKTTRLISSSDPGAGQNCACILSENFFADYGDPDHEMWKIYGTKEGQLRRELNGETEPQLTKKEGNSFKYGVGWLSSEEGINAIVDMHVKAIENYIKTL